MQKLILAILLVLCCSPAWGFGWSSAGGSGKRINLTVSGWAAQGEWSAATTYAANDVVTHNGSTWTAIQGGVNHEPTDGSLYWLKSIAQGNAATVSAGTVTQLEHGQSPTVTNTGNSGAAVFNFGIPAGAPGAAGADGRTVLTTSGAPSAGTGANGDYAYDPATYLMYGPKSAGAWPSGTLIKGADGAGFTGGTDGTYGWLTDSNTSAYTECSSGKYGLNFVGGVLYQCSNGTNSVFTSGDSLPSQTGNSGKYLTTNGTAASWGTIAAGSGIAISADIPTETGAANLNDTTHVLTVASSTGYTQFTGSFTAWDTTPAAFTFIDLTDVALSTTQTATPVQITGINYPTAVTATGGTAAICTGATVGTCGTFSASPGNIALNQYVSAQHTSSASNSTAVDTVVTIGGVSDTFTSTTAAGGAVVYMSPAGTKTTGTSIYNDWSAPNCYSNLHSAFDAMSSGDSLIIDDGTYSGAENAINQFNYPPSGIPGNLTIIKARNIPGQSGVPMNQPLKVIFDRTAYFEASNYPSNDPNKYVQYVKFEGLRWNGGLNGYVNFDHLYFKQCAVQGEFDGNTATIGTGGQNNLFEDVVAFGKGRYKFLFYDPSREDQSRGDGNNVCRRCIARHDWAKKNDLYKDPIAAFSSYFNRGTALLNSIVIDSDLPSYWMDNPGEISGAFYQPNDSGPHKLTIKGSIVLNTAMAALYTRQGSSGHVIEDVVAINTAGGFGLSGATSANRVGLFGSNAANYAYRSDTQMNNVLARNEGLFAYNSIGTNVINTVLRDVNGFAVNGVTVATDYLNIYGAVTGNFSGSAPSTHLITSDPVYSETNLTGGIKYPVRVEGGSTLQSSGLSGGQIGPTIMYRLGVDGAFKGDPDWDTPQGNLWPWPLEEWVQAEMRSMDTQIWSDGTGQVSPYDVGHYDTMPSPYRGFCATGQTLTKYIWESMGNQIPADIYGGVVPGICGSSNGLSLSTAPTVGLCSAGTASAVSGTGPWSWTCAGSGGGSTASCSATLATP